MSFQTLLSSELNRFNYKKPTDKQLDYIKTLQKKSRLQRIYTNTT